MVQNNNVAFFDITSLYIFKFILVLRKKRKKYKNNECGDLE